MKKLKWYYKYFIFRDNWCVFFKPQNTQYTAKYLWYESKTLSLWLYLYTCRNSFFRVIAFLNLFLGVLNSNFRWFVIQLHLFLFLNGNFEFPCHNPFISADPFIKNFSLCESPCKFDQLTYMCAVWGTITLLLLLLKND